MSEVLRLWTDGECYVAALSAEQAQRVLDATMNETLPPSEWQPLDDGEEVMIQVTRTASEWAKDGVRVV